MSKRNFKSKTCSICGRKFIPNSGVQKYCSSCGYENSINVQKIAKHRWYYNHKQENHTQAKKQPMVEMTYYDIIKDMAEQRFSAKNEIAEIKKDIEKLYRNNIIMTICGVVAVVALTILVIVK